MHLPAEALRVWLLDQDSVTSVVGTQISVSHHLFGSGWSVPSNAILLLSSGGSPDLYTPLRRNRVYVVCYGETAWYAEAVAGTIIQSIKDFGRQYVDTESGTVLILDISQASEIAATWEPELEVSAVGFYVEMITAGVSEEVS